LAKAAPLAPVQGAKKVEVTPAAPFASAGASARTYVVRAGDTLYGIAQRFHTGVDALVAVNRLAANAVIQPGLKLRLP
jgi:LysM repeat protein